MPRPLTERMVSAVSGVSRLSTVNGPSGDARAAALASRELNAKRSETSDGGGSTHAAVRARSNAPAIRPSGADGSLGAAEGRHDVGAEPRPKVHSVYGALDLGTNNCRLLIAKPSRRGFLVIDAFSRIIRLGEGVLNSGQLSQAAMTRTIEALKVCADKMHRRQVTRSRLIATEACRIAANSGEFIERVRRETGLEIEIVTQETEAKLAVSGCASLIDRNCDWTLVFDIGGGSSELIWLDLAELGHPHRRDLHDRVDVQNCIAAWTSLPIGVVNLAERHGGREVTREGYEAMVADVTAAIKSFEAKHRFGAKIAGARAHFLGTSGTVTTISGIHLKLPVYERSRVDGCWLNVQDVRAVSNNLISMSYAERVAQPCIGHERADLVLAGCAILEALLRTWPCQRLRVADRGLREGILAMLMAEDGHHRRGHHS
jgi:exopolyphosphatase / guanosine-5'-triphosphate,3'-diphosphate pyrophosphatase